MRCFRSLLFPLVFILLSLPSIAQQGESKGVPSLRQIDSLRQSAFRTIALPASRPAAVYATMAKQKGAPPAALLRSVPSSSSAAAGSPLCQDTSVRLTYSQPNYWMGPDYVTRTRDGNMLIPGWDQLNSSPWTTFPRLIKCTLQGDTLWSRKIMAGYDSTFTDLYKAFELVNGDILMVGDLSVPMHVNGRQDFLMVKLSASGSLLWERTWSSTLWDADTTDGSISIYDCQQDATGNAYLCGTVNHFGSARSALVYKMDAAGNIIWSKGFPIRDIPYFTGIDIVGDTVKVLGGAPNSSNVRQFGMALSAATGDTLFTKAWEPTGDNSFWHSFFTRGVARLSNGNYVLYGEGASSYYNNNPAELTTHYGTVELSPSFNFVKATLFRSAVQSSSNSVISVFPDGSAAYGRVEYMSPYSSNLLIGSYRNGQIVKERVIPYDGLSTNWLSNFLQLPGGGHLLTNWFTDSITQRSGIELIRLHDTDTSGSCLGHDTAATIVESLRLEESHIYMDSISTNIFYERKHPFRGVVSDNFQILSDCRQISYCDSLKLIPSLTTLCPGTPVFLTVRKNKACGAFPAFSYDTTAISSFLRVNDTTISINFRKEYKGYVSAAISGCKPLSDSVQFTVLQAPSKLSLGPDTVICPGNTVLLNARNSYASYRWQDGSKDSVFTITQPGKYYVTVTDACGGLFSDTVIAAAHPPIPFSIGPDTSICAGSSIGITAPAGFISYQWSPASGISSTVAQTVTLSPLHDIQYKVTAEQTPGCFASDSFTVFVKGAPPIHLGNDTTLCQGQSLPIFAGAGFSSYIWSTGETTPSVKLSTPGSVWVKGDLDGCTSADTLVIKAVYPLPVFSLGNDTTLCNGQQLPYSFSFPAASYLWSDGSALASQTINAPGRYSLQVLQNGCSYADTIQISYNSAPVFSLGNDTTLCEGASVRLSPAIPGAAYRWQDGSTAASYLVTQPGRYTLTASTAGCTTADTITVSFLSLPYFSLGKDTFLCLGQSLTLQPQVNGPVTYAWSTGATTPAYTISTEGSYALTATGTCGTHSDSISVTTVVCQLALPAAFTPNNDGVNDLFRVKYPFPVRTFRMAVFTRWGQKVWEISDMSHGWNGTTKSSPNSPGAYIWQISYTTPEGKEFRSSGTVILFR